MPALFPVRTKFKYSLIVSIAGLCGMVVWIVASCGDRAPAPVAMTIMAIVLIVPIGMRRPSLVLPLTPLLWLFASWIPWGSYPLLTSLTLAALAIRWLSDWHRSSMGTIATLIISASMVLSNALLRSFEILSMVFLLASLIITLGGAIVLPHRRAASSNAFSLRLRGIRLIAWIAPSLMLFLVAWDVAVPPLIVSVAGIFSLILALAPLLLHHSAAAQIRSSIVPAAPEATCASNQCAPSGIASATPLMDGDSDRRMLIIMTRMLHDVRRAIRDLRIVIDDPRQSARLASQVIYLDRMASDAFRYLYERTLTIAIQPVALRPIAADAIAAVITEAQERRISLILIADPDIQVYGDVVAIRRILDNLIANALVATAPSGIVTVRFAMETSPVGSFALLEVRDTGCGIAPDLLPRIFHPFVSGCGGSGLGLTIVADLVEAMHGTITVTSAVGVGSVFTVRLPGAAFSTDCSMALATDATLPSVHACQSREPANDAPNRAPRHRHSAPDSVSAQPTDGNDSSRNVKAEGVDSSDGAS